MSVSFEGFVLDDAAFELQRDGERVPMEPQVFEVLAYLVRHRDRVVLKTELMDEIWGSRYVSESAVTTRIKSARRAVGDTGRDQRFIKTIHGRGYRFVGPVAESSVVDPGEARPDPTPGSLPAERTPMFGRTAEVERVGVAVAERRLVSLLGIGGTGKTRLAVAAARSVAGSFADGVWFVDLVPVEDGAGIDLAIADAAQLAIDGPSSMREQVARLIVDRDALFVIDNAEHLVADVAAALDELLERTTSPTFLVTSRVPLGLHDEHRITIGPLEFDGVASPALELLVSTAERLGATLDRNSPELARVCRHLDGLPLAIELAAAQLRHLAPIDLVDRLDRRFVVLAERNRPGRERHASLHLVLADTLATVADSDRRLLRQMSAFPSTFSLDDLLGVVGSDDPGDVEHSVRESYDRSLVVRESGPDSRYRLLETVKLFVRSECDESELREVDGLHARWCEAEVGHDPRTSIFDFEQADWCFDHHDDLRAAIRHLTAAGRRNDAANLIAGTALAMHSDLGARASDALRVIDDHLRDVDDELATRLHVTGVMCGMAIRSPKTIEHHGRHAVAAATRHGDPFLRSIALVLHSWSVIFDDPDEAIRMTLDAADLGKVAADPNACNFADGYRAFHLAVRRRYDEAEDLARRVIARTDPDRPPDYSIHVAVAAITSMTYLSDPAGVSAWGERVVGTPSARNSMWGNDLIAASIHASNGDHVRSAEISTRIERRLRQAGQDPFPDLLIPPAVLAHRRGDAARAGRWLDAVRAAGRPTQSFQATILYRRLREAVGVTDRSVDSLPGAPAEDLVAEALAWLSDPD